MSNLAIPPRRYRLGVELRRLRKAAGLSGGEVGKEIGVSQSTVSKVEAGQTRITTDRVERWARLAGATDQAVAELVELARDAAVELTTWGAMYGQQPGGQARKQRQVAALEESAQAVRFFNTSTVPGPMQLDEYALQVLRFADPTGRQDHAAAVAERMARQRILYDRSKQFTFLITEGALRWRPGPPELMLAQLDRIAGLLSLPNVEVGLIPQDAEAPTLYSHGFRIYELGEEEGTLVTVELMDGEVVLSDPQNVEVYVKRYELLRSAALFGPTAQALLDRVAADQRPEVDGT
jgi:transcriptional regulator with XRE-family HTH domain